MRIGQGFQFLALVSDGALLAKAALAEYGGIDFSGAAPAEQNTAGTLY